MCTSHTLPTVSQVRSAVTASGLTVACLLLFSSASAQSPYTENTLRLDAGAHGETATIDQIAWLSGSWTGEALGGTVTEVWSPPLGPSMMGMFRLVTGTGDEREVGFYEFITIVEAGNTLEVRLKHFNSDLSGWEEKDDYVSFPLVKLDSDAAYFEGLTFKRTSEGGLKAFVTSENADGTLSELGFDFTRTRN